MGQLYREAQKLGFDDCDLQEFGLEASGSSQKASCRQSSANFIKYIDSAYTEAEKSSQKWATSVTESLKKAQCHPTYGRDSEHPTVKFIWNLIPLSFVTGQLGALVNLVLFPFLWWAYLPYQLLFADPFNAILSIIICGPFFFIFIFFVGPLFLLSVVAAYIYVIVICCGVCGCCTG